MGKKQKTNSQLGGEAVLKKYGKRYFSELRRKAWAKVKAKAKAVPKVVM